MAVKGARAKAEITKKILETFKGSFTYDKEIRIPMVEDGQPLQIKITMTAAKNMVEGGGDIALPGETPTEVPSGWSDNAMNQPAATPNEPSQEEKDRLKKLLDRLGMN